MAIFYFLLDSLVFVTQGVRALDACSSWLCSSAEETSCVGWWEKDLLDWSAWTRLPLPPALGREGETAAYWLCQMGLSSWVGYHGGQVGKQAVPHPGALHGAGLLGSRAERGGGQVLGTGCATCPARGSPTQSC